MAVYAVYAGNSLHFSQSMRSNLMGTIASSQLSLTDSVTCNIKIAVASNILHLHDNAGLNGHWLRDVNDYLSLSQVASPNAHDEAVFHNLFITQRAENVPDFAQQLHFTQSATYELCRAGHDTLTLTQQVSLLRTTNQPVTQALTLVSSATAYKIDTCGVNTVLVNPPVASHADVVFTDGTFTLTLPPPQFDNIEHQEYMRVIRKTRGGDLNIFRASYWPKDEAFVMRWTQLKQSDVSNILEFTKNTLGKLLTLTDYEGRTFTGVLRQPQNDVSQPARQLFSGQLEFETQTA